MHKFILISPVAVRQNQLLKIKIIPFLFRYYSVVTGLNSFTSIVNIWFAYSNILVCFHGGHRHDWPMSMAGNVSSHAQPCNGFFSIGFYVHSSLTPNTHVFLNLFITTKETNS